MSTRGTLRALKVELAAVTKRAEQLTVAIHALEALEVTGNVGAPGRRAESRHTVPDKRQLPLLPHGYPEAAATLLKANPDRTVPELIKLFEKNGRPIETSKPYRTIYKVLKAKEGEMFENNGGRWRVKAA